MQALIDASLANEETGGSSSGEEGNEQASSSGGSGGSTSNVDNDIATGNEFNLVTLAQPAEPVVGADGHGLTNYSEQWVDDIELGRLSLGTAWTTDEASGVNTYFAVVQFTPNAEGRAVAD